MTISGNAIRDELSHYLSRLWRYALVLSHRRDIADDLVQATCVRALERTAQFTPGSHLDRWLFSILHSIWINEVRAQHLRQGQGCMAAEELGNADNDEQPVWLNEVMQRVRRLPPAQRNALFLVYIEGLSYREAANVLAVPIGTVMSRLAAARLALADDRQRQTDDSHRKENHPPPVRRTRR
ncbi:RNA polymerase sigma factor [Serratia sp. FDAARGOS_506]|uniref:RNA polymerase sigma factor n=1 Tax=Serratia sp. FDAARGOS_506 TaxID=2420306 RepID=UPI000F4D2BBF|nr:RNA polymerase sigma factor [Serratia sp. FDAARGOS_506]AYZ30531.1 RNA polymerase sigma factor [Serratia sp. FDAARGOS_506]HAT4985257.1 RNA polymerase sigma factor [Serratia marcescens]HAT5029376.1 RNA polymerase sigma factor [Serratia marcescens]